MSGVRRSYGFECPWTVEQVTVFSIATIQVILFYVSVPNALNHEGKKRETEMFFSIAFFTMLAVLLGFLYVLIGFVDPGTDHGIECFCMKKTQISTRYCQICKKNVKGLDHHCIWLNTCVGKRNYPLFFVLITTGTLLFSAQTVIAAFTLAEWTDDLSTANWILLVLQGVISFLVANLLLSLVLFHIYLQFVGIGTYDWLIKRAQNQRRKQKEKREREKQRREQQQEIEMTTKNPIKSNQTAPVGGGDIEKGGGEDAPVPPAPSRPTAGKEPSTPHTDSDNTA